MSKKHTHRVILSKKELLLLGPQTQGQSLSMRTWRGVEKSFQKPGPGPIFHILRIHTKIDEKWMQMILRGEVGGLQKEPTSSFSELSHVNTLICKEAWLLWLPTPTCPTMGSHGQCLKVILTPYKRFMKETTAGD